MRATRKEIDDRTGFLLGAGASFQLGMPLVTNLTSLFKAFYNEHQFGRIVQQRSSHGEPVPDPVVRCVRDVLKRDDMHYEAILGFLQTESRRLGQDREMLQQLSWFYAQMVEAVYLILLDRQLEMNRYLSVALPPYDGLLAFSRTSRPLFVFSLNHDLMLEVIADRVGIDVRDGFWSDRSVAISYGPKNAGVLHADVLTEADVSGHRLRFFGSGEEGINLLKLHGALDVFAFSDNLDLCRLRRCGSGLSGILGPLRIANRDVAPWINFSNHRLINEIVHVDARGDEQFLRRTLLAGAHKFDKRHSQSLPQAMVDLFSSQINHVRHLYAVGYAFGDPHVDLVLRGWLETFGERRLTVVDPFRKQMPGHFSHLLPQISLETRTAAEFFESYRTKPLSFAERIGFQVREATRAKLEARMQTRYARRFGEKMAS